jgi:TPR repeat protein
MLEAVYNVKAAHHFNISAIGGSADGMFNLASVYLTGVGTEQSFQKAVLWYNCLSYICYSGYRKIKNALNK